MSLIRNVNISQNAVASTGNSSTTNLAVGNAYTFTGTGESTLGVNSIQVSLKTDKNCTVYVDQSPDNSNWDITDSYNYYASINNFGITIQAINSYVRVRVISASLTTTYFRLQTVLCPVADPLPRSLDPNGHLLTAVHNIKDEYGFSVENTPMGEMRAIAPYRLVGALFDGSTIDSNFWTSAASGTAAAIAQSNAQILLTSGTANAATVTLYSARRARYVGGASMRYRAVIQLGDTGTADNRRRWGIGYGATMPTITDGAYFQLDGTEFSINTMIGTSPTKVTSFNGDLGASYTPTTNVTTYEIYWTNSKVYFVIGDEILHTVSASTATWSATMNLHIFADSLNSGALGASVTMSIRTATIYRLGNFATQPMSKYQSGTTAGLVLKYGAGNVHGVLISGVTNNAVVTLYDNTAASGTVVWSSGSMGAITTPFSLDFKGLPFSIGLTLLIATANANATVIYE